MTSSNAAPGPPVAAGVTLTQMHRRIQLGRIAVWVALAAGPLALGVAALQPSATVAATPAPKTPRTASIVPAADPSGYAAEFVDAWLRSTNGRSGPSAERVQSMAPGVALPSRAEDAPAPRRVTPVRSAPRGGGVWSVTVAAQYADSVRYFTVPAAVSANGGSFVVTAAPALVAAPARLGVPDSGYGVTVEDGPLTETAEQFLSAYLAGQGEVARYLAPGVKLSAVSPAAATSVSVREVGTREDAAADGLVPRAGTRVHVLVQVEARDGLGRWPLAYELAMTARGGRWEIAAMSAGSAGGER